jgi:2-polyprenyl-3-methyl-5-hydroxy-6-metoxy-1,4-benzoquinol methylase
MKEAILEPLLRRLRIKRVLPTLKRYPGCRLLDIGCGWDAKFLRSVEPFIAHGCGMDFKAPSITTEKIHTLEITLDKTLPFKSESFDVITMLAVLEHLEHHVEVVEEAFRVLKPGGAVIVTAPSHRAKPVLEFLAYRLGIVSKEEIMDHKRYFGRSDLLELFRTTGFSNCSHRYFQWGMNNFCLAEK